MKRFHLLFVAITLIGLAAEIAMPAAQVKTGDLSGTITFDDGTPAPGVTITITGPGIKGEKTAVTDAQGQFRFPKLPVGEYRVRARLEGFSPVEADATIRFGENTQIKLPMKPAVPEETTDSGAAPIIDARKAASGEPEKPVETPVIDKSKASKGASLNQQGGSITGEVYVRERENGDDSLLIAVGSMKDPAKDDKQANKIDEVRVTLPKDVKFNLGYAPPEWEFKQDKKKIMLKGPPGLTINIRLDAKDAGKDDLAKELEKKKVEVEALSGGNILFNQGLLARPLPQTIRLLDVSEAGLNLPNRVSSGESFLASVSNNFSPLPKVSESVSPRPIDRVFFNYNFFSNGTWNLTVEGKGQNPPELYRGGLTNDFNQSFPLPSNLNNISTVSLLAGEVPAGAKPGDKLHVTFNDPWGEQILNATADQVEIVPAGDTTCPPSLNGSAPQVFAGQTLCLCACFPDVTAWFMLRLDGLPVIPAAASMSTVILRIPDEAAPGPHSITFNPEMKDGTGKVNFLVLKLIGSINQNEILKGNSTTMKLQVLGTKDKMPLEIENKSPKIIMLGDGAVKEVIETSGGPNNIIERNVKGIMRGEFKIDYKLALPPCPCPEKEAKAN